MSKNRFPSFRGGIHPPYMKELSSGAEIVEAPVPPEVAIPLSQHLGAPNKALVKAGDKVKVGQRIGESDAFINAPVHSSVAGVVKEIRDLAGYNGTLSPCIIIKADAKQPKFKAESRHDPEKLTAEEIRGIARDAGLTGLGGASFPTHAKLTPPKDKPVDTVVINGCECEPFLTCDHRLMLERTAEMVSGIRLLMKAVNADRGIIGIEANKMDAVEKVRSAVSKDVGIEVVVLEVKYPEGAEKQLISAVTGRKVPPGKLPSEVGCLVQNVGTAVALNEAVVLGKPLYERVVTVSGQSVKNPGNFLVRVGTPISTLVEAAGGLSDDTAKLIMGGPMTGWAQESLETVVQKCTSGVLALSAEIVDVAEEHACVRCGKCIDACPMALMPNFIVEATQKEEWEKAEMWGAINCYECGCCTWTCPSYIPHVAYIRKAKAEIAAARRG